MTNLFAKVRANDEAPYAAAAKIALLIERWLSWTNLGVLFVCIEILQLDTHVACRGSCIIARDQQNLQQVPVLFIQNSIKNQLLASG